MVGTQQQKLICTSELQQFKQRMNYPTVEEILYGLNCELWDISHLQPAEFVGKAMKLARTGAQRQIVQMIMQAIQNYQQERAILNYIYIVDKLLKIPTFNENLQIVIVDLYCLIFISLWTQRCLSELEQLKILRKFWVGSIHPVLLQQMKQNILLRTSIDIDSGFKPEAVSSIKDYYESRLRMTPQQVQYYLPKYHVPRTHHQQNYNQPQKENRNRLRKYTDEETKNSIEGQFIGEKPRKKVHKQKIQNYSRILQELRKARPLSCRICGKNFCDSELLKKHTDQHIIQNIWGYEKGQKNRRKEKLKKSEHTMEEWQEDKSISEPQCNKFCIPVRQLYKYECKFCCAEIQQRFRDDEWMCINAVRVENNGNIVYMHKTCHDQLVEDLSDEP